MMRSWTEMVAALQPSMCIAVMLVVLAVVPGAQAIFCTSADCNFHDVNVTVGSNGTWCDCTCRNNWTNTQCQDCPPQYDPVKDCGACNTAKKYVGTWPNCVSNICNISIACVADNTLSVSGTVSTGCVCNCRNKWAGQKCETCPEGFNATNNCGSCVPGYAGYPTCSPVCTIQGNCSSNANAVSGTWASGCNCTCLNKWNGTNCSTCPVGYDPSKQCGDCAAGYAGYPNCDKLCTISADCSGNAGSVSGTVNTNCTCYCLNRWYGKTCANCPYGMNTSSGCDACVDTFSGFPNCSLTCTNQANCSGNAKSVSGTSLTGCTCTCRGKWSTGNCSACPVGYNASEDCSSCLSTYQGYPLCQRTCTVSQDCSNNAITVAGVAGNCSCSCRNQWSGLNCSKCALPFGPGPTSDCDGCADGYVGYPNCVKNCSTTLDCSGHATSVVGYANGTCACTCRNSWANGTCGHCGAEYNSSIDCHACADGYEGTYPNCILKCTVSANCSGHATFVSGNTSSGCYCQCVNKWISSTCSVCPDVFSAADDCNACSPLYEVFPSCYLKCTNVSNCTGHASNVSGNVAQGCNCTCQNQWTNSTCNVCPMNFDAAKNCGACAPGYDTYPSCFLSCTKAANCSGHASSVSGNTNTGCNCTCSDQWTGPNCSACASIFLQSTCAACAAGYGGYPNCQLLCSNVTDCNNRATAVSGFTGNCSCACQNKWMGASCDMCPMNYNISINCGACADGYDTYPACYLTCTTSANCSGNAINVTGNTKKGCNCTCRNGWSGANCSVCPLRFNESDDCGSCAPGYANYPSCSRICIASDCSNHAANVSGLVPNCVCTCRNNWTDSTCGTCPSQFNASADCGTCAAAYAAFSAYPNCFLSCTTTANCSGHATAVTGNSITGCNCTCADQWRSSKCNFCPTNYTQTNCSTCANGFQDYPQCPRSCTVSQDCSNHATNVSGADGSCLCSCLPQFGGSNCSVCAPGYANYPSCSRICIASDCSNHAANVSGLVPNCVCTCRNNWTDSTCGTCPSQFNASADCGTCAAAYAAFSAYPNCFLSCTTTANCSGHATAVTGNSITGCNCTCRNAWNSSTCAVCPLNFNATADCGSCANGFQDYPQCPRSCTSAQDCSGHAISTSGAVGNCTCNCRNQWRGATCDMCDGNFNTTADCGSCQVGYDSYPGCYLTCTAAANCTGHAVNVTGNTLTGCNCSCRNAWTNSACDVCPVNYNASKDCGECAQGYSDYSSGCHRVCTLGQDCSNHATNVTGLSPGCNCTCRNSWSGSDCSICLPLYNVTNDCTGCGPGYEGTYPGCYLSCTISSNCSNHASSVTGNTHIGCNCTCLNKWNGTDCGTCPSIFDQNQDCGTCAVGYGGYPVCYRVCSTELECSGHASVVNGTYPNCTCSCRNQWLGATCNFCPPRFNSTNASDCGVCMQNYEGYPICVQMCTNSWNCSNHAKTVLGNASTGCTCACSNMWTGSDCSTCPLGYNPATCGSCAAGYGGYPNCSLYCTPNDCSNHSVSFSGYRPKCICKCRNKWTGSNCSACPVQYDGTSSADCDRCATGYSGMFPNCSRVCTIADDCSGNAVGVSGTLATGCICRCRSQWTSANCGVCPHNYNASDSLSPCGTCNANGTFANNYPNCSRICTIIDDCSGNAVNVSGLAPDGCICGCRNLWMGASCATCPKQYNGVEDCNTCAKYRHHDFPICSPLSRSAPTKTVTRTKSERHHWTDDSRSLTLTLTKARPRTRTPTIMIPPSTAVPTTESPTTAVPTTAVPTTSHPSTEAPGSTAAITTSAPTNATSQPTTSTSQPTSTSRAPDTTATTVAPTIEPTSGAPTHMNPSTTSTMLVTNTTVEPTATTNSTTAAPPSSTSPPSTTLAVMTTLPNTTSSPATSAQPTTAEPTPSSCTPDAACHSHATAAAINSSTGLCECTCDSFWQPATRCATCPANVNASMNCAACVAGRFVPPLCLVAVHVVWSFTLNGSCAHLYQDAPQDLLFVALSSDIRAAILARDQPHCLTSLTEVNQLLVVTLNTSLAPTSSSDNGKLLMTFDVAVLAQDISEANMSAWCIASTPMTPALTATRALLQKQISGGDNSSICFAALVAGALVTSDSPCGVNLCAPNEAVVAAQASPASSGPPIGIIVGVIVGLLVLGAAVYAGLRHFRIGSRRTNIAAFADAGKFTKEFIPNINDEELRLHANSRMIIDESEI